MRGTGSKIRGRRDVRESRRTSEAEVTLRITGPMQNGPAKD